MVALLYAYWEYVLDLTLFRLIDFSINVSTIMSGQRKTLTCGCHFIYVVFAV